MVVLAFKPSTEEKEVGRSFCIQGQPGSQVSSRAVKTI